MSDESLEKQAITWHERRKRVIGIWLTRSINPRNGANVNYFEQFTDDELLLLERAYRATENQFKHKADQCHCVRQSRSAELVEQQRQRISALEARCDYLMRPIVEEGNQAMRLKAFEEAGQELINHLACDVCDCAALKLSVDKLRALLRGNL